MEKEEEEKKDEKEKKEEDKERKKLIMVQVLGQGKYGTVYLAKDQDDKKYAVKTIEIGSSETNIQNEIFILANLSSYSHYFPYILYYYGTFEMSRDGRNYVAIMTEYIEGPTLEELIKKRNNVPFPFETLIKYMYQLASAFELMHFMKCAHRDIKPENILLDIEKDRLKVIDFGLACMNDCSGDVGSPLWRPPESFMSKYTNNLESAQKHDVWSMGIVFYELANLSLPFNGNLNGKSLEQFVRILQDRLIPSRYNADFSENNIFVNSIIDEILTHDPKNRPNTNTILKTLRSFLVHINYIL